MVDLFWEWSCETTDSLVCFSSVHLKIIEDATYTTSGPNLYTHLFGLFGRYCFRLVQIFVGMICSSTQWFSSRYYFRHFSCRESRTGLTLNSLSKSLSMFGRFLLRSLQWKNCLIIFKAVYRHDICYWRDSSCPPPIYSNLQQFYNEHHYLHTQVHFHFIMIYINLSSCWLY